MKNTRISKGKLIRPIYYVFCEGETEIAYVKFLKQFFRVNVVPIKENSNISDAVISRYKKNKKFLDKDRIYLMFDLDIPELEAKLKQIKNVVLLCSKPCMELWFVLHYESNATFVTARECVERLKSIVPNYRKGHLESIIDVLHVNMDDAIARAHQSENEYCYTKVCNIIDDLREAAK